jgi:uncharacterized protein (TIGR03086 family)
MTVDLRPAAQQMAGLVRNVRDDQLDASTPCTGTSVAGLLDHVDGLSLAFEAAARKDLTLNRPPPPTDPSRLAADWRERIPVLLDSLAAAWQQPSAWTGMTAAGGIDLPGEVAGIVALDELVLHGWDLAKATTQRFAVDPESLEAVHGFVQQFSGPGHDDERRGLFGPEIEIPADAPLLDRVLGMAGREPGWSPPA